jgi:hypothetical protein
LRRAAVGVKAANPKEREGLATDQATAQLVLPDNRPRIKRYYYYQWVGDNGFGRPQRPRAWDSGLVNYHRIAWPTNLPPGALVKPQVLWKARPQFGMYKQKIAGGG